MSSEEKLRKALKSSIRTQEKLLNLLRKLGKESGVVNSISLKLILHYYNRHLDKLKRLLEDD